MRVIMMLKSDAQAESGLPPDEQMLTDMGKFNEQLFNAGVLKGGEGLHPSTHGARVRISKGKTTIVDGPFAEAKELVAGYFLLETKTLKEAVDWALKIPGEPPSGEGEIELRPLYETEDFPVDPAEQPGGWRDKEIEARASLKDAGPSKGHRYISLLKADKNTESGTLAPSEKLLQEMGALMQEMTEKGVLISGDGLKPTSEGAKVFASKGKRWHAEGPFKDSRDIIAGFTVYRAKTKEEAIEWARRCLQIHVDGTGIDSGEIEVRRVFEIEEIPASSEETSDGWRAKELELRKKLS